MRIFSQLPLFQDRLPGVGEGFMGVLVVEGEYLSAVDAATEVQVRRLVRGCACGRRRGDACVEGQPWRAGTGRAQEAA